ncbi:zinc finger protein RFP-like isoform X2 [Gopherus evgoodei]|uniref:zinc finger protein RFP-like isoform X2 n=1 Tax=Gopherus evgoodei TaxID=1825980 RepID=UPI0011CF5795|nr:zinc finger protein RFP-like isoform X2 [Gopherus evgoodei]
MAAANPAKTLQDEVTCPICLEYFKDPVSLDCDHSFCRACITQCGEGFDTDISCPQCREIFPQRNLRLNRQLRNIVEAARELRLQPEPESLCEKHKEPLKLFCKEDEILICLVCDRSKEHKDHTVIPTEEAAEEFQEKIQAYLQTLREEREKLLGRKASVQMRSQEYLQLRQFLEEQERLLLGQLAELNEEIVKIQNENITKLSGEISHLSELVSEMEGKCQKPASEFLQDVRSTLSRCEKGKFQQPEEISPELEERVSGFSQKTIALLKTVRKFKDTLLSALETKRVNVTLDPDTVHPQLVLSEDWKSVRWEETRQDLPDSPERFDTEPCVLGCEGFTSGRHCWEVEVGDEGGWFVGVARESVRRKGQISPEEGICAVGCVLDQFWALTSPATPLPLSRAPSRIRVCLDCDRGQVTFIGAGDEAPIFTFPPGSVPGERIRPWLWVLGVGSRLHLRP